MKKLLFLFIGLLVARYSQAQTPYISANFAAIGDTFYLTQAQISGQNFNYTGSDTVWNYSGLVGTTQNRLIYGNPTQSGFSIAQWPYVFNSTNTNLYSTDGTNSSIQSLGITFSDRKAFYKKNQTDLRQTASSYKVNYNNISLSVKNQFTSPDFEYIFPITTSSRDSGTSTFTTSIQGVYYQYQRLKRKNTVDGYGLVLTPVGQYPNAIRVVSEVIQYDSISLLESGWPAVNRHYREIKWLDPSEGYPVLFVVQNRTGNSWVTTSIQYLDSKKDFPATAAFSYLPVAPIYGDSVSFQNVSQNATQYAWNFGDLGSGGNNQSSQFSPQHLFSAPGVYQVRLIASNSTYSDTLVLPVVVNSDVFPVAQFTFANSGESCRDYQFTNQSTDADSYVWNFGDSLSVANTSVSENPTHRFSSPGTYVVRLTAIRGTLRDSTLQVINVVPNLNVSVTIAASSLVVVPGSFITYTATPTNGGSSPVYQWEKNGSLVNGVSGAVYNNTVPHEGDVVRCFLTSSSLCAIQQTATSNTITLQSSTPDHVEPPVFSPVAGTYSDPIQITLTSATPGAKIYYTTNGNNPVIGTGFTKLYSAPFSLLASGTVRALAAYTNVPNSAIVTANYAITNPGIVATPVISPATGTYQGMQTVTITCSTSGASVYYTTNGNLPDVVNPNSYTKLYSGSFTINASATIRAIGVKSGIQNSAYAVSYITILNPSATVATPVINPGTGSYAGPQSVTITCGTQGATIYYTTTGNVPVVGTSFTKMYTGSFTVNSSATIRAMATLTGSVNSGVSVAYLTIGPGRKSVDEMNQSGLTAQAFPNPFRDRMQILVTGGEQNIQFVLTDVQGKQIDNYTIQSVSGNQFELLAPGIPSGLYILRASAGMNSKSMMIRKD